MIRHFQIENKGMAKHFKNKYIDILWNRYFSICVETSLRDGFNIGYDVILISDATASGIKKHYDTTIERSSDYSVWHTFEVYPIHQVP